MPMRPEEIEALLAQLGQGGADNPMARAISQYSGQQPGLGAGMMPQSIGGGAPPGAMPPPMPPAPLPKMGADRNTMPVPPPEQYPGGPTGLPPGYQSPNDIPEDEAMLNQVQEGMGGDASVTAEGDMEADAEALVDMYASGDPSDPDTLEDWRRAKEDFVRKYGSENLPELPNDPDAGDEYGSKADQYDQLAADDSDESQRQQSTGEFESFRKRHRRTIS